MSESLDLSSSLDIFDDPLFVLQLLAETEDPDSSLHNSPQSSPVPAASEPLSRGMSSFHPFPKLISAQTTMPQVTTMPNMSVIELLEDDPDMMPTTAYEQARPVIIRAYSMQSVSCLEMVSPTSFKRRPSSRSVQPVNYVGSSTLYNDVSNLDDHFHLGRPSESPSYSESRSPPQKPQRQRQASNRRRSFISQMQSVVNRRFSVL